MTMPMYTHDPEAVLDYSIDWASWLADGETITSHTVTVPAGLTKDRADTEASGKVTTWLTGGTVGTSYIVTCHIVSSQGRADDRSIRLRVADR